MSKRNSHAAKQARRETRTAGHAVRSAAETHEPEQPLPGWPGSHVSVNMTSPAEPECIAVRIHGVTHYLHSTTAAELHRSLGATLREWNTIARAAGYGIDYDA